MRRPLAAALLFVAFAASARYPAPGAPAPEAAAKPPAARIADVAWLQGYWVGWEEKDEALRIRLSRLEKDEMVFGRIAFQRQGADKLVAKLGIREKSGEIRHETLTYRRKPL